MSKLSSPRPPERAWLAVLPPTLFFDSGSVLLASARFLYAERERSVHVGSDGQRGPPYPRQTTHTPYPNPAAS